MRMRMGMGMQREIHTFQVSSAKQPVLLLRDTFLVFPYRAFLNKRYWMDCVTLSSSYLFNFFYGDCVSRSGGSCSVFLARVCPCLQGFHFLANPSSLYACRLLT